MTIDKKLFIDTVNALQKQYDIDKARAKTLSEIYGSDIDPNDNCYLTGAIFNILQKQFVPKGPCYIEIFCYDQNFGREVNKSAAELWDELVRDIDVIFEEVKG